MAEAAKHRRRSVLFISSDSWGCAWYRCYVPGAQLKALGYQVILDESVRPADVDEFDVIVFQRQFQPEALAAIKAANAAGKFTVYEIDDDVWTQAPSNPGYAAWAQESVSKGAADCMRAAQMITTTTPVLAEKLRRYNSDVRVLKNMLPLAGWDYPTPRDQRDDRVVLGWAGSTSHVEDLNILAEVVPQILDRYPQTEFVYAGGPLESPFRPDARITRVPTTEISGYAKILERFDVGLIPLVDTAFNRAKSDLKFIEYGMQGIPTVASKVEPYLHSIKHGENGFLATNPKDWLKFLSRMIESPNVRREIGARAQAFARNRTIDKGIDKWVRAYGLEPIALEDAADIEGSEHG